MFQKTIEHKNPYMVFACPDKRGWKCPTNQQFYQEFKDEAAKMKVDLPDLNQMDKYQKVSKSALNKIATQSTKPNNWQDKINHFVKEDLLRS